MSLPRVSVVIPSLDQAAFLPEAIDSVLCQDYPGVELLVMDGGSTDGSEAVLRSYGDRISTVIARDSGQADAINRGFERVSGDVIAWLAGDVVGRIRVVSVERRASIAHAIEGNGFRRGQALELETIDDGFEPERP